MSSYSTFSSKITSSSTFADLSNMLPTPPTTPDDVDKLNAVFNFDDCNSIKSSKSPIKTFSDCDVINYMDKPCLAHFEQTNVQQTTTLVAPLKQAICHSNVLYVRNLSSSSRDMFSRLLALCSQYGKINREMCKIGRPNYAIIHYIDKTSAETALLAMNGMIIDGRRVSVCFYTGLKKKQ